MTEATSSSSADKPKTEPNAFGIGCAVLTVAIGVASVAGIVYVLSWLIGSTAAIVIVAFIVIFVLIAIVSASASEKKAEEDKEGLKTLNFNADVFDALGHGEYVAIDKAGQRIAIKVKGSLYLRKFCDIVAVELEQDGSSIEKANRGSQFEGALTGALLAGPAGMLLGGLSGSKRIEQKVHALTLNVFTRDLHAPTIKVPFLRNSAGAALDSGEYQRARKLAQDWYGRIRAAL